MSKRTPTIQKYMSKSVLTAAPADTVADAEETLRRNGIRHLPILDGERLVGLLSDRDVALLKTVEGIDPGTVPVSEAMTTSVYTVAPDAGLDEVAADMADRKIGSAVVVEGDKVVGVFTAIDGLRALGELLHARPRH